MQKYVAGKSIVEISSEEKRNRVTISKIVRGPEMGEFVWAMRERFFGLGFDAISAVWHALREQNDGRLGFQILAGFGVIPSPEERPLLAPPRAAIGSDDDVQVRRIMTTLIEEAIQRVSLYGLRAPELDEDLEKVGGRINYETGKIEPLEKKTAK